MVLWLKRARKGGHTVGARRSANLARRETPSETSHVQYDPKECRVRFATSDNQLLVVDRHRLKGSGVFRAMLESAHQGDPTADAIDVDVPAKTLAILFDLLGTSEWLAIKGLTTDIEQTYSLVKLADKFDIEWLASHADERMKAFDAWDVLAYASSHDDLELGRRAIRQLPFKRHNKPNGWSLTPFWEKMEGMKPSWQLALIKSMAPLFFVAEDDELSTGYCFFPAEDPARSHRQVYPMGKIVSTSLRPIAAQLEFRTSRQTSSDDGWQRCPA